MIKLFRITTTPVTFNLLLKNQLKFINEYFDVYAISNNESLLYEYAKHEGVKCFGLRIKREINLFSDLASLFKFYFLFKNEKPYIVHTSTPKSSLLSMIAANFCGIKVRIYQVTGLRYESESGFKRFLLKGLEKITCYCATNIIAESIGVLNLIQQDNLTKKNITIISNGSLNGVDTSYWSQSKVSIPIKNQLISELHISNCFVFIFIGRMVKDKGIEELVKAFLIFQKNINISSKLLVLGNYELNNNPISNKIINEINNNSNIIFLGFQEDVRKYLSVSNCLVLPSYREGFPNVCLQASSMGLPIIMTNVCGSDELIKDFSGYLVNKYDYEDLYDAMLKMFNKYSDFDSKKIRNHIVNKYSQDIILDDLLDFYKKC